MASASGDFSVDDVWELVKTSAASAWSKTTRRMRVGLGVLAFFVFTLVVLNPTSPSNSLPTIPKISLDYTKDASGVSRFNASKVALLIENRPNPILAPLMIHFMSVVPPDWRFRFMGSLESVRHVNNSRAIRDAVTSGKLDLTYIPANMTTGSQEEISQFLTNLWLYETVLAPAEWLLVYQTDSMLCANSRQSLNSFLEYDWVGAPWNPKGRFGGNGGLSLRRVSAIVDVLRNQQRPIHGEPEDVWLTDRLGHRPHARLANGTVSAVFSGEMHQGEREILSSSKKANKNGLVKGIDDWRDGFYEPMGYHTGGSGKMLHAGIWGKPELRKHIWQYCPEMKITLDMDALKYVPGDCHANWKREDGGALGDVDIIDGVEYPMLPDGLMPW